MFDIVAVGELLIDFTPAGTSRAGNELFERNPGGAPGNVLAMAAKLGGRTAFIGKVGDDRFGHFLEKTLNDLGIETGGLVKTDEACTTLAFVHLDDKGDRSFSFNRKPGADMLLRVADLDETLLKDTRIFHFGTVSMTDEPSRSATLKAVAVAKESGAVISFDPNLRPLLWKDLKAARETMLGCLKYTDILKISEVELEFLTELQNPEEGTRWLAQSYDIPIILVTLGPEGCFFRVGESTGKLPAYPVKTIDTTGAGDAFLGAFLYKFIRLGKKPAEIDSHEMQGLVDFANAAGSLATTKKGAIPALPSAGEIELCIMG